MLTENQSPGEWGPHEQDLREIVFRLFKENKTKIAIAITKEFPFLMSIRDLGLISEQKYKEFMDSCGNLVPVERVMYDVLDELEKNFDKRIMETLFSEVNVNAYPNLLQIYNNLGRELSYHFPFQELAEDPTETLHLQPSSVQGNALPEAPAPHSDGQVVSTRDLSPHHTSSLRTLGKTSGCARESEQAATYDLRLPQNTNQGEPSRALSPPPAEGEESCDPEAPQVTSEEDPEEGPSEVPQVTSEEDPEEGPSEVPQVTSEEDPEEGPSEVSQVTSEEDPEEGPSEVPQVTTEEDPEEGPSHRNCAGEAEDSHTGLDPWDEEQPQLSSPGTSRATAEDSNTGLDPWNEEQPQLSSPGTSGATDLGNNSTAGKRKKRRKKKRAHCWTRIKRKYAGRRNIQTAMQNKRSVSRKPRYEHVNFHAPILPVICGEVKGELHKKKLQRGTWVRSIQGEDGVWLTPRAFEMRGGRARSKNWKMSVRCGGRPLKRLMEEGFLHGPPRSRKRKRRQQRFAGNTSVDPYPENSDTCEVCRAGGVLLCCDTCPRSFHEDCHIPPVEIERSPWSCTFCEAEASSRSQQSYGESEVLARRMQPAEQLIKEISEKLKEPMWLDKIKKRLNMQRYSQVEEFVQDMRLIFQNHRASYKSVNFGLMGLKLEAEFEKNFKEVFAIQETNDGDSLAAE